MAELCFVCSDVIEEDDRLMLVLVRGRRYEAHCSATCLRINVGRRRLARAAARRRWLLIALAVVALPSAASLLWQRYRAPDVEAIASGPTDERPKWTPPPEPTHFGPAWPPTDSDWLAAFAQAKWIYPLPGPLRRTCTIDGRICGPDASSNQPAICRIQGRCGVNLGGNLWGEHVYAVHDGIVDRVQGIAGEDHGGQYVRLSHFGGMVFTQYLHLAAIPRGLVRGARVRAGDIVGLLGDTGVRNGRQHLHFTLSVRPSHDFPEVYWDPRPLMEHWPLRLPARGTVAGLASEVNDKDYDQARRRRMR